MFFYACNLDSNIAFFHDNLWSSCLQEKNRGGVPKRQFAVVWNTQHCAGEKSELLMGSLYGIVYAVVSAADVFHNPIMSK